MSRPDTRTKRYIFPISANEFLSRAELFWNLSVQELFGPAFTSLANFADLKHRISLTCVNETIDIDVGRCCGGRRKIQTGHALAVTLIATVEDDRAGMGDEAGAKAGSHFELIRNPGHKFQERSLCRQQFARLWWFRRRCRRDWGLPCDLGRGRRCRCRSGRNGGWWDRRG